MHATADRNPARVPRRRPGPAGVTRIKSHHSNPGRHCLLAAPVAGGLIARRPGRASRLPADPAEHGHVGGLAGSGLRPPARA